MRGDNRDMTSPVNDDLARARSRFLRDRRAAAEFGRTVPLPIAGSWRRSAQAGVDAAGDDTRRVTITSDTVLSRCARDPMNQLVRSLGSLDVGIVLSDEHSHVLARADCGRAATTLLNGIDLAPGFDFSEGFVGTNGVGTVIQTRMPIYVEGAAHFQERFLRYVCAGAPILHPITKRLEGVLDLTCDVRDASQMMQTVAVQTAHAIEQELLRAASPVERGLFDAFEEAVRSIPSGSRAAVLAATDLMTAHSDQARTLLTAAQRTELCAAAFRATEAHGRARFVFDVGGCDRPSQRSPESPAPAVGTVWNSTLRISTVRFEREAAHGVLIWAEPMDAAANGGDLPDAQTPAETGRHLSRPQARAPQKNGQQTAGLTHAAASSRAPRRRGLSQARPTQTPALVDDVSLSRGSRSNAWQLARRELGNSLRKGEATLLLGEIGVGKVSLVNEVAHAHRLHVHVVSAETIEDCTDLPAMLNALTHGGQNPLGDPVIVLRNVHLLPAHSRTQLERFLRAPRVHGDPGRIVLTAERVTGDDPSPLSALLPFIARTVIVPALRERRGDIPSIARSLLDALQPGRGRRLSATALQTLAEGHWPGNIHQLSDALRFAVEQRPDGVLTTDDLPPHAFSAALRPLTELERQERIAIITMLYRTGGNRSAAARALGISRATIYRRLAEYGLS